MLQPAPEFLKDELNLCLKRKDPAHSGKVDCIVVSGVTKPDRTYEMTRGPGK